MEKKTAPIIVIASSLKSLAVTFKKTIGIKMLIKTIDVEIIANITSFDLRPTLPNLDDPDSIFCEYFPTLQLNHQ